MTLSYVYEHYVYVIAGVVATLKNKNNNICPTCGRGVIIILLHTYYIQTCGRERARPRVCTVSANLYRDSVLHSVARGPESGLKISRSGNGNTNTKN